MASLTSSRRPGLCRALALMAGLAVGVSAEGQTTHTFVGPNNGVWSNPAHWDPAEVPNNMGKRTYNAIIPASRAVVFDMPAHTHITNFQLGAGATLLLDQGECLTVDLVNVFGGTADLTGAGTMFNATSEFSGFQANSRILARSGATAAVRGSTYAWNNNSDGHRDLFVADGAGSTVDLVGLGSWSTSFNTNSATYYLTVRASNGGIINLPALTTVAGASGNDWLRFTIESGGAIHLPLLATCTGRVFFNPEIPAFELKALRTASSAYFDIEAGNSLSLPAATSLSSTTIDLASGATASLGALATMSNSTFTLADGTTVTAPNLTAFTGSYLSLNPTRTFQSPAFTNIDNGRVLIAGGMTFAVADPAYVWNNNSDGTRDVFVSDGSGSVLDLSSIETWSTSYNTNSATYYLDIRARNSGLVDLSGLQTLAGASGNDWVRITAESGGVIDLSSLQTSTGRVLYNPEVPLFRLPALASASSAYFDVETFNTLRLDEITAMSGCTLDLADGARVEAPNLRTFTNSFVSLNQSRFLQAPPFESLTNSRILVSGGITYAVAAPSYTWNNNSDGDREVFVADGAGTAFDLSSIGSWSTSFNTNSATYYLTIDCRNQATMDLSGLQTVVGAGGNDWLRFRSQSGGTLQLGEVIFQSGRTQLIVDRFDSTIDADGLNVRSSAQLLMSGVSRLHLSNDLTYNTTTEGNVSMSNGVLVLDGAGTGGDPQSLEVGGSDLGLPTGTIPSNFQIGQLVVGDGPAPTTALLVDNENNGNRGPNGEPELLYLQGFPAEDGLRILPGSRLYIGDIEVYAVIASEWTRLRDLFGPGQTCIPFDQGTLCLGEPLACYPDCETAGGPRVLDIFDFLCFQNRYAALDPYACDCDTSSGPLVCDIFDFLCFQNAYDAGCP